MIKKTNLYFWLCFATSYSLNTFAGETSAVELQLSFEDLGLELSQIPEKSGAGFNRALQFSHDNQLFALFQLYENDLGTIRIWDTKTGQLKYKTAIDNYQDAAEGGSGFLDLKFSPDNDMLIITGMVGSPLITWEFNKNAKVQNSCASYMGVETVDISPDNKTYVAYTVDNELSLCQPNKTGERLNYKTWMPEEWWGTNTQVLYKNKLLTIYNYRTEATPIHQAQAKPNPAILDWLDVWDLNFTSKAEHLMTHTDTQSQSFFLIESFSDKTVINQWNYANKQFAQQSIFNNIKTTKFYASDKYLLLRSENKFSLISRNEKRLELVWSKDFSVIYQDLEQISQDENLVLSDADKKKIDPYSIQFSSDNRTIILFNSNYSSFKKGKILTPVILVDTRTGDFKPYPPSEIKDSILIDPQGRYFLKNQTAECTEEKTKIYSLLNDQDITDVKGEVMAVSPNGNLLATCHHNKLSLQLLMHHHLRK